MIAVGIVAAGLIKSCKIGANYEVYIFAAGALVYILGEIAVNASYKDIKDKTIQYNENGNLTNEQEKALKDLKKSYEDIKNITQIKQMLQLAAMAAFLGAAGIATYKWIKEKAALKACLAAVNADLLAIKACAANSSCNGSCNTTTCETYLASLNKQETLIEVTKEAPSPSIEGYSQVQIQVGAIESSYHTSCTACPYGGKQVQTVCFSKHLQDVANAVACNPVDVTQQRLPFAPSFLTTFFGEKEKAPPKINAQFFDRLFSVIIPKAYADGMGAMLGIGAAGLGILAGLIITKKFWTDKLIPFPNRRAILFAAVGALAGMTALLTSNIKKKAQDNIDKIDKILNQYANYDNASTTTDGGNISGGMGVTQSGQNVYGKGVNFANGQKLDCMATTSSGACANYNDLINNAKKEADENDKTPIEGLSIDPSLISATNALGDGINGVQGNSKISGETLGKFAQVAASQGAARAYLDNVRKKLNEVLKDNGEDEIDFAQQEQQAIKEMQDDVIQKLRENGTDLSAEIAKGNLGPAYQQELKDAKQSDAKVQTLAMPLNSSLNKKKKSSRVRDLPSGVYQGGELTPTAAVKINGEDEEAAINSVDGPSLWEILMHRYHNFWPRFLPQKDSPTKK